MLPRIKSIQLLTLSAIALGAFSATNGCLRQNRFSPNSNWYIGSHDLFTYESTSWLPQTVTIVDTRTGEAIWSVDVPVGEQVVIDFDKGGGTSDSYPDTMRWAFFVAGTGNGRLRHKIAVPPADARLIEPSLRPAPELPGTVFTSEEIPGPINLPPINDADTRN